VPPCPIVADRAAFEAARSAVRAPEGFLQLFAEICRLFRHPEPQSQIDDRNHRASQIDQAFDVRRRLRHSRDLSDQDDLLDFGDLDAVLLIG